MSITEFLLARIAEDEAVAQAATPGPWDAKECAPCTARGRLDVVVWGNDGNTEVAGWCDDDEFTRSDAEFMARHDPARVLAECAAKRAILAGRKRSDSSMADDEWTMGWSDGNYDALRALAAVYADHEDYEPAWAL